MANNAIPCNAITLLSKFYHEKLSIELFDITICTRFFAY